jgi:hypothetical protein
MEAPPAQRPRGALGVARGDRERGTRLFLIYTRGDGREWLDRP